MDSQLKEALDTNDFDWFESLVQDPNTDLSYQDNFLIKYCSEHGYTEEVRLLLQTGNRIDPSVGNNVPIYLARKNCHYEILRLLLNDSRIYTPFDFYQVCCEGDLEIVRFLLTDDRVNPNCGFGEACEGAYEAGDLKIIELLLNDRRLDPLANSAELVEAAYRSSKREVIMLLLKDGRIDPSCNDNYCIKQSAERGHYDILKILCADKRVDKKPGLKIAIKCDNIFSIFILMLSIAAEMFWYTEMIRRKIKVPKDVMRIIQMNIMKLEMYGE